MSPWSTSRATPSLGSSPCPRRPRSIVPSITGSDGASRRCSPTSSPGASGWKTASSATQSGWGACPSSWRWPCIGPCPRACGTPRIGLCPPKKSLNAKAEQGGPRPNFPLQARPAPHPTSPSAPDPAPAPLERLAELMDGKAAGHTLVDDLGLERVGIVVPAGSATETFRPAGLEQVLPALPVGAEPGQERRHVFRQIVRKHRCPTVDC